MTGDHLTIQESYEELEKITQYGSDFYPHALGVCAHPHNRPEPYNNRVVGLTKEERLACVELLYELRGGMECIIKH